MAINTSKALRNQVMYSIFVRNYSPEGTFKAVEADLPRIKALGVDVIWLLPIHPLGEAARKGTLGSPYANRDYRAVNPEFGTLEDFIALTEAIHAQGMRVIIDVVYNHTSPDSVLATTHPEWFHHMPDGSLGNHIGDWADVVDLDYSHPELWDYQIETLKYWARYVDGFRCDVAPLVPLAFWQRARAEVAEVRPDALWLAESVEADFIRYARGVGVNMLSDSEIFQAFDVSYDYDVYPEFRDYLTGQCPLARYLEALNRQEAIYPDNYVKLRFLENHDRPRAAFMAPDARARRNWTAFLYFQKGMTLLYNGQEASCVDRPGLFDADRIDWEAGENISPTLARLREIKRHPLLAEAAWTLRDGGNDIAVARYAKEGRALVGVFSLKGAAAAVRLEVPGGEYTNLIDGVRLRVEEGLLRVAGEPIIFEA